jgi:hypothetical protein
VFPLKTAIAIVTVTATSTTTATTAATGTTSFRRTIPNIGEPAVVAVVLCRSRQQRRSPPSPVVQFVLIGSVHHAVGCARGEVPDAERGEEQSPRRRELRVAWNVFGKVSHESNLRWTCHPLAVLVRAVFTTTPARRRGGGRADVDRQRIIAATFIAVDINVTFITAEFATSFPPSLPFATATATTITATAITTHDTTNDTSDIVTTVARERRR